MLRYEANTINSMAVAVRRFLKFQSAFKNCMDYWICEFA